MSSNNNLNTNNKKIGRSYLLTLNDLMDDMTIEQNDFTDMVQEQGEIYDKEKERLGLKATNIGRYGKKYS